MSTAQEREVFIHYLVGMDVTAYLDPVYGHLTLCKGHGRDKPIVALTIQGLETVLRKAQEAQHADESTGGSEGADTA
jgi:hypothetical protein